MALGVEPLQMQTVTDTIRLRTDQDDLTVGEHGGGAALLGGAERNRCAGRHPGRIERLHQKLRRAIARKHHKATIRQGRRGGEPAEILAQFDVWRARRLSGSVESLHGDGLIAIVVQAAGAKDNHVAAAGQRLDRQVL